MQRRAGGGRGLGWLVRPVVELFLSGGRLGLGGEEAVTAIIYVILVLNVC